MFFRFMCSNWKQFHIEVMGILNKKLMMRLARLPKPSWANQDKKNLTAHTTVKEKSFIWYFFLLKLTFQLWKRSESPFFTLIIIIRIVNIVKKTNFNCIIKFEAWFLFFQVVYKNMSRMMSSKLHSKQQKKFRKFLKNLQNCRWGIKYLCQGLNSSLVTAFRS